MDGTLTNPARFRGGTFAAAGLIVWASVSGCASRPAVKPAPSISPPTSVAKSSSPAPSGESPSVEAAPTPPKLTCDAGSAQSALEAGIEFQRESNAAKAIAQYQKCLGVEPGCAVCRYELGWSYWTLSKWSKVVEAWEGVLKLDPNFPDLPLYLERARDSLLTPAQRAARAKLVRKNPPKDKYGKPKKTDAFQGVPIGTHSTPPHAAVELTLVARFQNYEPKPTHPDDHFDPEIFSPKSARFSLDGSEVFINSLEGMKTVIYEAASLRKLGSVSHVFTAADRALFSESAPFGYLYRGEVPDMQPNVFSGKPVESELSHRGRYLWVPYYRREFDEKAVSPSAAAIIDTRTRQIRRVMATGPIAKYVLGSPDGKYMAISHWGDNTVALIDIRSDNPKAFFYAAHVVVERELDLDKVKGDRDKSCGFCLRGMTFSPDSRYLFVARMGGGGIAVIDLKPERNSTAGLPASEVEAAYVGTIHGFKPTPRDIHVSRDGDHLYTSSNLSGVVTKVSLARLLAEIRGARGAVRDYQVTAADMQEIYVGPGARTIHLSPDEKYVYAAVNLKSELAVVETATMKVVSRVPVDSYPVGLAVSPRGDRVWVTSQGRSGEGGNSVGVYAVSVDGRGGGGR
ncbi:MAG: beta-propeller fold lactonase family protein [Bacteriovoracia bacterium]